MTIIVIAEKQFTRPNNTTTYARFQVKEVCHKNLAINGVGGMFFYCAEREKRKQRERERQGKEKIERRERRERRGSP